MTKKIAKYQFLRKLGGVFILYFSMPLLVSQTSFERDTIKILVAYDKDNVISGISHDQLNDKKYLIPFDTSEKRISIKNYKDSILILRTIDYPDYKQLPLNYDALLTDNTLRFNEILKYFHSQLYRLKIPPFEKKCRVYGFHSDTITANYLLLQMDIVVSSLGFSSIRILNINKRKKRQPPIIEVNPFFFLIEEILNIEPILY